MKVARLLIRTLVSFGPLFCLASCGGDSRPSLSSVSISVGPVVSDPQAEEAKFEDFSLFYVPEVEGYLIGDYKGNLTSITIPYNATGEDGVTAPIRGLADNAFYGRKDLTTVILRSNITYIGDNAFANTDITDLRLDGCKLSHVGAHAFDSSKVTFYEKDGISYLPSINNPYDTAFGIEKGDKLDSACRQVIIKSGITAIEDNAFANCNKIVSVVIPSGVTSIGKAAFYGCDSLTTIRLPSSVKTIGYNAFDDSLTTTYISLSSIEDFLSIEGRDNISGGVHLIDKDGSEIKNLEIPDSVTSLKENAFFQCASLTSIRIPASVTFIDYLAFKGCWNIESIIVDENNENYDSRDNCNAIIKKENNALILGCVNTVIPSTVNSIGPKAFAGSHLEEIIIPSGVTSIGYSAFDDCWKLVKITLPDTLTEIGSEAFHKCEALKEINAPSNLATIGFHAFYECKKLESIIIPESVTFIDNGAFYGCSSLTIYCRAKRTPSGWESGWNTSRCPVVWGYQG